MIIDAVDDYIYAQVTAGTADGAIFLQTQASWKTHSAGRYLAQGSDLNGIYLSGGTIVQNQAAGDHPNAVREITNFHIYNPNVDALTFRLTVFSGVSQRTVFQGVLATSESLHYTPATGWRKYNASGTLVTA